MKPKFDRVISTQALRIIGPQCRSPSRHRSRKIGMTLGQMICVSHEDPEDVVIEVSANELAKLNPEMIESIGLLCPITRLRSLGAGSLVRPRICGS